MIGLVAGGCESPSSAGFDAVPDGNLGDVVGDVGDDREASASPVCARWRADYGGGGGRWTGAVASCDPGTYEAPGPEDALRQVNLYRWLADLPEVGLDPDKSADAQACALMMHANDTIEHVVPESWECWTREGAAAAGLSNLATTSAVQSVDLYMTDNGVPNLGHRRWLLSNSLGPIGVGSTSRYSCLHVLGGEGDARARWVAWPPPGEVPVQALHIEGWLDVDSAGWSLQSDYIDVRRGEVTVMRNGTRLSVSTWVLDAGYGSSFGLGIRPVGWRTAVGETYEVTVTGLAEAITWSFTVVDCR